MARNRSRVGLLKTPHPRLPLHDAVGAQRKAERLVEAQHAAIEKASEQIAGADGEIDRLQAAVAKAEESDTLRAAANLKNEKGKVAVGWSADQARRAVENCEERLAMTRRARERLQDEMADLQRQARLAANAVVVERDKLIIPLATARPCKGSGRCAWSRRSSARSSAL